MAKNYHDIMLLNLLKYLVMLALFALFLAVFLYLGKSNFKIPQSEITVKIDLKNKINLCLPQEEKSNYKQIIIVYNQELILLFIEKIKAEDGLSINTALSYQRDLELFVKFLNEIKINILEVDLTILRKYLLDLDMQGLRSSSISRKISCLKNFYKFLLQENLLKINPTSELESPKKERHLPKFLNEQEILKLLEAVNNDESEFGLKLATMLEIMYSAGLRVSELVSLPFSCLAFDDGEIRNYLIIKGKGGKERIAILNNATIKILKKYLLFREAVGLKDSKWLFVGNARSSKTKDIGDLSKKTRFSLKHITRQRFHGMLKELAYKVGIDASRVHPHVIRHSFATHLLNNGIDLRILQELLGHSDITTTEIYTHIINAKLKQIVEKHHPLAKIDSNL
jgi:integrase/recombinase XerD